MKFNRSASITFAIAFAVAAALQTFAAPVVRQGSGANAAALQAIVDLFRSDLGGSNNGVGGSFTSGRREINWDGVPDSSSLPNFFPGDFFNVTSARGIVFGSPTSNSNANGNFMVSATAASGTAVRFANIDPSYSSIFQTFSSERLFAVRATNQQSSALSIQFFIPGTEIPATVKGFGAVFCDVDVNTNVIIRVYGTNGKQLTTSANAVSAANNGLSFFGISFNAGERIARVEILVGNGYLGSGVIDGTNGVDLVAMDDFIYGEPRAMQYHPSDFDGDGTADRTMFRPSTGQWFVLQSGSNTLTGTTFGTNGDVPVEGDFDGDSRSDFAIWRPSTGQWIFNNSATNSNTFVNLGAFGDKPVPGDYDKDGKTDPAVWRPTNTGWYYLESSNNYNTFNVIGFGIAGDIPVQGSSQ